MRTRRMAGLLFADGLAAGLGAGMTTTRHRPWPRAARASGSAAEILELG